MAFEVEDIEATVAALRARGVIFEEYPKGLGSAIRMIQYFINRGGRRLPASRHRELERAKGILQRKQHSAR